LDVDAKTSMVVAIDPITGTIVYEGRLKHDPDSWRNFLERFPNCRLWACYEAGVTGFGLCRMLRRLGIDCQIVAPAAVPKSTIGKQIKNDRRDALALAQLFVNRPRTFVRVPTEQEEADRQLIRTRSQLTDDRVRTMSRIKMLLLQYGFVAPAGKGRGPWTKKWRQWLKSFDCEAPVRSALNALIAQFESLEAQIRVMNEEIRQLSRTEPYHDRCQRLCKIRGVGILTAMAFLLEVFRPEDFPTATRLASHLGLTQCEYSSAGHYRRGHITHWGPAHLRKLLVEAAWVWINKDSQARRRYYAIRAGKERKRAIVGMARRLAIAMWAMTVKEHDYAYQWYRLPRAA
jgi:transposase